MKKIFVALLALMLCASCVCLAEEAVVFEEPILLTSVGQSADYQMLGALLTKVGMTYDTKSLATGADLEGVKTLVLAIGGSSKGLGAAGINADQELARVMELLEAAKAAEVKIISLHIGGEARRGELSDKFITPSIDASDYAIVVEAGDKDGFISNAANAAGIPIELVKGITDVGTVFAGLFA